jgi:hypothetical protein
MRERVGDAEMGRDDDATGTACCMQRGRKGPPGPAITRQLVATLLPLLSNRLLIFGLIVVISPSLPGAAEFGPRRRHAREELVSVSKGIVDEAPDALVSAARSGGKTVADGRRGRSRSASGWTTLGLGRRTGRRRRGWKGSVGSSRGRGGGEGVCSDGVKGTLADHRLGLDRRSLRIIVCLVGGDNGPGSNDSSRNGMVRSSGRL